MASSSYHAAPRPGPPESVSSGGSVESPDSLPASFIGDNPGSATSFQVAGPSSETSDAGDARPAAAVPTACLSCVGFLLAPCPPPRRRSLMLTLAAAGGRQALQAPQVRRREAVRPLHERRREVLLHRLTPRLQGPA